MKYDKMSVWVLLPGPWWGWRDGSLWAVWSGGSLEFFGGRGPASDLNVPLACKQKLHYEESQSPPGS